MKLKLRRAAALGLLSVAYSYSLHVPPTSLFSYGPVTSCDNSMLCSGPLLASTSGNNILETSENDEEIGVFFTDSAEVPLEESSGRDKVSNQNCTTPTNDDSSYFIQRKQAVGIGGNSGVIYDVNALKRNLVQESVRGFKQELLVLLCDRREYNPRSDGSMLDSRVNSKINDKFTMPMTRKDRDDLLEDRLAALVQANPVSTTTDSNLLDGEWFFAFATDSASKILDTSRFLLSKSKRMRNLSNNAISQQDKNHNRTGNIRGGPWCFRSGNTENPFRSSKRHIFLENLGDDENAHIVDETRLLGVLHHIRRYDVFGLSRTALDLDLTESESTLFGFCVRRRVADDFKGTGYGGPIEVQILYLDTDLCICTTGLGLDGPLHVYTKCDLWVSGGPTRRSRMLARTASWLSTLESPFQIRRRLSDLRAGEQSSSMKSRTNLKTLNIGELNINRDGTTIEDPSWDGEDDPFYHLTPSERMDVLRTMSLQDIYRAERKRKTQNKKEKRWWGKNDKQFKKPDRL